MSLSQRKIIWCAATIAAIGVTGSLLEHGLHFANPQVYFWLGAAATAFALRTMPKQ